MKKNYSLLILLLSLQLIFSSHPLLLKYSKKDIYNPYITFESKDFKNDEEMYFSIEAFEYSFSYDDEVHYRYLNSKNQEFSESHSKIYKTSFTSSSSKTEKYRDVETNYFKIKKKNSEFGESNGDYVAFEFPIHDGDWALVSNTELDEGKMNTIITIVVVVVVVAIVAIVIIILCVRRIKAKKELSQNQAKYSTQQNIQSQNINNQNYQAQSYQAQIYQNQINQTPIYSKQQNYPQQNYPQPNYYPDQYNPQQNYPQINYNSVPYNPQQNYQAQFPQSNGEYTNSAAPLP